MTVKSHKTGPGLLKFGDVGSEVEWGSQVRSCTITPSVDKEDPVEVLSGEKIGGARTETYTLSGSILQSLDMESLQLWAHVNAGVDVPFEFRPNSSQELGIKGVVTVERIPIGGDVDDKRPEVDFEFDGVAGASRPYELINSAGQVQLTYPGTAGPVVPPPPAWAADTPYDVGDDVTVAGGTLECSVAGTSGSVEPALPAGIGGTVEDNTVTWTRTA